MTEFDVTSWADQAAGEMQERTEPTTAAGRAMFADFGHPNFVEKWNAAILAIEAEARAAALDEARAAVETSVVYRYILPIDDETTPTRKHRPFDMVRRGDALAAIDALREGKMTTDDTRDRLAAHVEKYGCLVCGQSTTGYKPPSLLCHDCTDAHYMEDALPFILSLADAPDEGLRAIEQAVQSKAIRVEYRGSTAYVRLANVYAALAAEEAERG